jgi:ATP-dependent Clp protease protease subunit
MYRFLLVVTAVILGLSAVDLAIASSPEVLVLSKNNTVVMSGQISNSLIAEKQKELLDLIDKNKPSGKPIYVFLDTPGGSVFAGNSFIDTAALYKGKIHTITYFAASMGYHMVQSLGTRYILPSGILMSHRASLNGVGGQLPGELVTAINFFSDLLLDMDKVAAARVKIPVEEYRKLIYDEYWVTGKKAVTVNQADKLAVVKCDESLNGTETKGIQTIFGTVEVTVSKCPIIRGIIKQEFKGSREQLDRAAKQLIFNEVQKLQRKAVLSQ